MNTLISRLEANGKTKQVGTHAPGSLDWHAQRSKSIGGSDIAIIMGRSPWSSPFTLYHEKLGLGSERKTSFLMRTGQILEPAIIELFKEQHPDVTVHSNVGTFASKEQLGYHANPDAIVETEFGDMHVLEIKYSTRYWRDGLPEHYKLQVLWYQYVTGLHNDAIVAALTPYGYQEYMVQYDLELVEEMKSAASEFLTRLYNYVAPEVDGTEADLETRRSLTTIDEDQEVELDETLWNSLVRAMDMQSLWTGTVNLCKNEILEKMNNAKYGYVNGELVVSLRKRGEGKPYLHIE